jgi:hypothetical protein
MSDSILYLIPELPPLVPEKDAQQRAVSALRALLPRAGRVEAVTHDKIEFINPMENFEAAFCPHCGLNITENWRDWMDKAYQHSHFEDLRLVMPCCSRQSDLNSLRYEWPAGFARFELTAHNPDCGWLTASDQAAIEKVLGCKLRQVLAHI